jgi:isocitrate dehydrogenase
MADQEDQIIAELMADRGNPVDQGGYYHPDPGLTAALMRPSATLNAIIDG